MRIHLKNIHQILRWAFRPNSKQRILESIPIYILHLSTKDLFKRFHVTKLHPIIALFKHIVQINRNFQPLFSLSKEFFPVHSFNWSSIRAFNHNLKFICDCLEQEWWKSWVLVLKCSLDDVLKMGFLDEGASEFFVEVAFEEFDEVFFF